MSTGGDRSQLPSLYLSFNWSNAKVWALELAVHEVPLSDLEWHLAIPVWSTVPGRRLFDLAPMTVLEHPREHGRHYARVLDTSVHYPIDTILWEGAWVILDGVHRLAKLWLARARNVRIRRVPPSLSSLIHSEEETDD